MKEIMKLKTEGDDYGVYYPSKFKELETIYYADIENNKVVKALWWNWSSRCSKPELDVICINLNRKDSKSGFRLEEDELLRVDIKKIFKTQEEADILFSLDKPSNIKT